MDDVPVDDMRDEVVEVVDEVLTGAAATEATAFCNSCCVRIYTVLVGGPDLLLNSSATIALILSSSAISKSEEKRF